MNNIRLLCCYYDRKLIDTNYEYLINIQCGKDSTKIDLGMIGDNTGENISLRNKYWSEITALYWAWKNLERIDYIGLCSYRRFFNFNFHSSAPVKVTSCKEGQTILDELKVPSIKELFMDADVIAPRPYEYAYSIRRVCSMNYKDKDFSILEDVLRIYHPEFVDSYNNIMYGSNKIIGHNMFIMRWEYFTEYCEWVFDILFKVEKQIEPQNYPTKQVRVFGYMHELLLMVFLERKKLKVKYSQIMWINNDINRFHFNSIIYRYSANTVYSLSKFLLNEYPHILNK